MKTEPSCYSIDDLKREKVGMWDDVRNYQARNFMRKMKRGDKVLFYHSSADPVGIVGIAEIAREGYPDPTQFDKKSYKFEAKATKEKPMWTSVDVRFKEKFKEPLTLAELKNDPFFNDMLVTKRGMRLSVQPVSVVDFKRVIKRCT